MGYILLADDNASTRSALIILLHTRLGNCEIDEAVDRDSLIEQAIRRQPDLIDCWKSCSL